MIAKTKYHTIAESNFSLWFALLSPFNRHLFRHPRRIPPLPLKADTKMKTTRSSILVAEVPGYAELQREMHHALRAQHPEWIEADGKSPTCDYYESRFAELLVSHRAHARAHDDYLRIQPERILSVSLPARLVRASH